MRRFSPDFSSIISLELVNCYSQSYPQNKKDTLLALRTYRMSFVTSFYFVCSTSAAAAFTCKFSSPNRIGFNASSPEPSAKGTRER